MFQGIFRAGSRGEFGSFSGGLKWNLRWILIQLVLFYRMTVGQFMGGHCRYEPTCSQYAIDAINKYGALRGAWKAIKRVARCHPWGGRGYDPA